MTIWFEDPVELAKRRKEIGMSQQRLGELAGLSRSVVRNIEGGRTKLRGEHAQKLWTAISREMHRQEQCNNVFAARFRGGLLPAASEPAIDANEFFDLVRQAEQQRRELADLRTRLAEIAERVDSLHAQTQAATADEGTRILEENAAHEGATK